MHLAGQMARLIACVMLHHWTHSATLPALSMIRTEVKHVSSTTPTMKHKNLLKSVIQSMAVPSLSIDLAP